MRLDREFSISSDLDTSQTVSDQHYCKNCNYNSRRWDRKTRGDRETRKRRRNPLFPTQHSIVPKSTQFNHLLS